MVVFLLQGSIKIPVAHTDLRVFVYRISKADFPIDIIKLISKRRRIGAVDKNRFGIGNDQAVRQKIGSLAVFTLDNDFFIKQAHGTEIARGLSMYRCR